MNGTQLICYQFVVGDRRPKGPYLGVMGNFDSSFLIKRGLHNSNMFLNRTTVMVSVYSCYEIKLTVYISHVCYVLG